MTKILEDIARFLAALLMVLCLSACAPAFSKGGVTPAEGAHDDAQCQYEADRASGGSSNMAIFNNIKLHDECMRLKGYYVPGIF